MMSIFLAVDLRPVEQSVAGAKGGAHTFSWLAPQNRPWLFPHSHFPSSWEMRKPAPARLPPSLQQAQTIQCGVTWQLRSRC